MSQIRVQVRHDVLLCNNCGVTLTTEDFTALDSCPVCDQRGEVGSLHADVTEAEIFVDEDNLENVEADPAFVRVI